MSLIQKNDVKNRLSARRRANLHAVHLIAKQPEAGLAVMEPTTNDANDDGFTSDFSLEHSSAGGTITAVVIATSEDIHAYELPRDPKH